MEGVFVMKFVKSKIASGLIGVSVLFVGANVYATTTLNTNIISLINNGVQSFGSYFSGETKNGVVSVSTDKQGDISAYVIKKTNDVDAEFEATKNSEIARAQSELSTHYTQLVTETDAAFKDVVTKEKAAIKAEVDKEIAKAKSDLTLALEEQLKDKLDKKIKSNNGNAYGNN
jgi:hypothetical protein